MSLQNKIILMGQACNGPRNKDLVEVRKVNGLTQATFVMRVTTHCIDARGVSVNYDQYIKCICWNAVATIVQNYVNDTTELTVCGIMLGTNLGELVSVQVDEILINGK